MLKSNMEAAYIFQTLDKNVFEKLPTHFQEAFFSKLHLPLLPKSR